MPPVAAPDSYVFRPGRPIYAGLTDPQSGEPVPSSVPNELIVSLPTGSATNYPLQFGRAFAPGVVPGVPEVLLGGTPVSAQQADVKTRHADGSVKFAVLSVILPTIGTTEQTLVIGTKAAPAAPAAETVANMLANYDFEATIGIAVAGVQVADAPVSARAMLATLTDSALAAETAAGGVDARYWTVGPVCTTLLLHNHTAKTWDVGTNATKAIRPMFIVQFWPGISRYHVEHIMEVADVTKIKDETGIDVTFTTGLASPVTRLSQAGAAIYNAQVVRRQYWGGADVPRANVKHGVAYMASTRAMPNHDPSITIVPATLTSYATEWAARSKAIGATGFWNKYMPAVGGRQDLGLVPKWDLVAMYSGDARLAQMSEDSAELFCSFNCFWREGSASKNVFGSAPGNGRILSKLSRPTVWWYGSHAGPSTLAADRFNIDGTIDTTPADWQKDDAHCPGPFWIPYLMTGSFFYYEKLLQMGSLSLFWVNPGLGYNGVGSGASATHMIFIAQQIRATAWQFRNRGRAWWAAVDGAPEKQLFDQAITDAIAQRAGLYDIPGLLVGHPIRDGWAANRSSWYTSLIPNPLPNALGFVNNTIEYTSGSITNGDPDDSAGGGIALWQQQFVSLAFLHIGELGHASAKAFGQHVSKLTVEIAASSEPRHLGDYAFPCNKADGSFYQDVEDIFDGWAHNTDGTLPLEFPASSASGFPGRGTPNNYGVQVDAYGAIAASVVAMADGVPKQAAAWAAVEPWYSNTVYFHHDPTYAILPRAST